MNKKMIEFTLNGQHVKAEVSPQRLLIEFLREDLGLTGTKRGCGVGECGACTVIVDGQTINSCMVLAAMVDGSHVETIEGLNKGASLHPLQQSFIDYGAVQCGFCTPGMVLSAKALLDENPHPMRQEIKVALSGNVCRCTGYQKIVDAVEAVANSNKGGNIDEQDRCRSLGS